MFSRSTTLEKTIIRPKGEAAILLTPSTGSMESISLSIRNPQILTSWVMLVVVVGQIYSFAFEKDPETSFLMTF
jgi:hypothetical protein